jgi:polysaccharide biosynthesis/export protein
MKILSFQKHLHDDKTARGLNHFVLMVGVFLCGSWIIPVLAQTEKTPVSNREEAVAKSSNRSNNGLSNNNVLAAIDEDYRIGPNDVIEIEIDDAPELSGARRVNANGTFLMPYLGRLVAKGKTPEDLAQIIATGLDQRYLFNPRVNVVVKQYNSRSFFIQGSVHSPGVYQIEGRPTLLELLTVAGGLTNDHASTAFIIRRLKASAEAGSEEQSLVSERSDAVSQRPRYTVSVPSATNVSDIDKKGGMPQYTLFKTNLVGLLRGNFAQNFFLEPGDIVNIPQTEMFFVAGEVQAPGSFALKQGTSLRQAIALAQGMTFKAAANRAVIFRENQETGQRQEIQVDVSAVMSGKTNDLTIQSNDIIIVPNSKMKTIAAPMLSALGLNAVRLPIRY